MKSLRESILSQMGMGGAVTVKSVADAIKRLAGKYENLKLMYPNVFGDKIIITFGEVNQTREEILDKHRCVFILADDDAMNLTERYPEDYSKYCVNFYFQNNQKKIDFNITEIGSDVNIIFDGCSEVFIQNALDNIISKAKKDCALSIRFGNNNCNNLTIGGEFLIKKLEIDKKNSTKFKNLKISTKLNGNNPAAISTDINGINVETLDLSGIETSTDRKFVLYGIKADTIIAPDFSKYKGKLKIQDYSKIGNLSELLSNDNILVDLSTKGENKADGFDVAYNTKLMINKYGFAGMYPVTFDGELMLVDWHFVDFQTDEPTAPKEEIQKAGGCSFILADNDKLNLMDKYPEDYCKCCDNFYFQNMNKKMDLNFTGINGTNIEIAFDGCGETFIQNALDNIISSIKKGSVLSISLGNNISNNITIEGDFVLSKLKGDSISTTNIKNLKIGTRLNDGFNSSSTYLRFIKIGNLDLSGMESSGKGDILLETTTIDTITTPDFSKYDGTITIRQSKVGNLGELLSNDKISTDNMTKKKSKLDVTPNDILGCRVKNDGYIIGAVFDSGIWGRTGEAAKLFQIKKVGIVVKASSVEGGISDSFRGDQFLYLTPKQYDTYYKNIKSVVPEQGDWFCCCHYGKLRIQKAEKITKSYIMCNVGRKLIDRVIVIPEKLANELGVK